MRVRSSLIILILSLTITSAFGQKNTFSPYSRYGLGEVVQKGFATHLGLGGTNTAVRMPNQLNYLNPASYTTQDTNSFIFDVGLQGRSNLMKSSESEINKKTAGFDYLAIGFPVTSWWNASIGVVPYTNVGYNIVNEVLTTEGTRSTNYQGKGGLRKFYIGNAFELFDNFSVGFNYSYLFGTISYQTALGWNVDSTQVAPYNILRQKEKIIRSSQVNIGVQYTYDLNESSDITIGGSYEKSFNSSYKENFFTTNGLDTLRSSSSKDYSYPDNFSLGFAYSSNKFLWGLDYNYTTWSQFNNNENLKDSYSVHTGIQYTPDRTALRSYLKRINYRIGGYYRNSYLDLNGNEINDFGMTFGLGLPLRYNKTKFNLSVSLGKMGTTDNNLIESNYVAINLGITFYDYWFIERKYQ